jgi:hypothetical protein
MKKILILTVTALGLVSCAKPEIVEPEGMICATIAAPIIAAYLDGAIDLERRNELIRNCNIYGPGPLL